MEGSSPAAPTIRSLIMKSRACANDECENVMYGEEVEMMAGEYVGSEFYCYGCVDEAREEYES